MAPVAWIQIIVMLAWIAWNRIGWVGSNGNLFHFDGKTHLPCGAYA